MTVEGIKINKERRWSFKEKTEVGEKMINETGVAVKRAISAARQKWPMNQLEAKEGHHQELPQDELQLWRLRKKT